MLKQCLNFGPDRNGNGLGDQDIYSKFQCPERRSSASSTASTASNESNHGRNRLGFCQMSRQLLANKFHKNWTKQASNESGFDDSLTNLNWLHNVNPIKINEQLTSTPTGYPRDRLANNNYHPRNHYSLHHAPHVDSAFVYQSGNFFDYPDYKNNPNLKPPFPYAVLISWAMKELGKPKITLSDIYGWIVDNFAYYRYSDSSWQNSVRHNLSLGKCFEKVPRRKDEPGKGGFWRINPDHMKTLDLNLSKIKYNSAGYSMGQVRPENPAPMIPLGQNEKNSPSIGSINSRPLPDINPTPVKRSRKSPIRTTPENWDSLESFNKKLHRQNSSNVEVQNPVENCFEELFMLDDHQLKFNDFSSMDNSSSCGESYSFMTKGSSRGKSDLHLDHFDTDSLGDVHTSPMLLSREEIIDSDDFKSLASEFPDLFATSKDDLQELNTLLGIY